jgi:hypothetical protein
MDDVRNARKRRMKRFHKQMEYYGWYWTDGTQREYYYQSADNTGLKIVTCITSEPNNPYGCDKLSIYVGKVTEYKGQVKKANINFVNNASNAYVY